MPARRPGVAPDWRESRFGQRGRYLRQALFAHLPLVVQRLAGACCAEGAGILTYHRVAPLRPGLGLAPLHVTPARLRRQLAGLLARGYQPWTLEHILRGGSRTRSVSRRAFAVVFDDGLQGVYRHALPVLRALRVPATVLLPTYWLDRDAPLPGDNWPAAGDPHASDTWKPLRRDECRALLASGLVTLGSHGHRHYDFRGDTDGFRADLQESLQCLRDDFGIRHPPFSLPYGAWQPDWDELLQEAGVACCLTTDCQLITRSTNVLRCGRFGAEQYDSPATLAAKLDGWYSCLQNRWRSGKRRLIRFPVCMGFRAWDFEF